MDDDRRTFAYVFLCRRAGEARFEVVADSRRGFPCSWYPPPAAPDRGGELVAVYQFPGRATPGSVAACAVSDDGGVFSDLSVASYASWNEAEVENGELGPTSPIVPPTPNAPDRLLARLCVPLEGANWALWNKSGSAALTETTAWRDACARRPSWYEGPVEAWVGEWFGPAVVRYAGWRAQPPGEFCPWGGVAFYIAVCETSGDPGVPGREIARYSVGFAFTDGKTFVKTPPHRTLQRVRDVLAVAFGVHVGSAKKSSWLADGKSTGVCGDTVATCLVGCDDTVAAAVAEEIHPVADCDVAAWALSTRAGNSARRLFTRSAALGNARWWVEQTDRVAQQARMDEASRRGRRAALASDARAPPAVVGHARFRAARASYRHVPSPPFRVPGRFRNLCAALDDAARTIQVAWRRWHRVHRVLLDPATPEGRIYVRRMFEAELARQDVSGGPAIASVSSSRATTAGFGAAFDALGVDASGVAPGAVGGGAGVVGSRAST